VDATAGAGKAATTNAVISNSFFTIAVLT
jgi:hypothetical protein